jgi:hypothetical protein
LKHYDIVRELRLVVYLPYPIPSVKRKGGGRAVQLAGPHSSPSLLLFLASAACAMYFYARALDRSLFHVLKLSSVRSPLWAL